METREALRLAELITYKPGWSLHFELGDRPGTLYMEVDFMAPNSDRRWAAEGYPQPILASGEDVIDVAEMRDADELYAAVLAVLVRLEVHEACEFLRTRRGGEAPFHPHRAEGVRLFESLGSTAMAHAYAMTVIEGNDYLRRAASRAAA